MRLSKHCAAAVMLALVLGHRGFAETKTKSVAPDEPATDGVVASDYNATTVDETPVEQDDIGRAQPVSYTHYAEPTPHVPRMAHPQGYPQAGPSYGHLPVGAGGQYPGMYQHRFASASARQVANGGCDAGGCGCAAGCDAGCGCEGGGASCGCDSPCGDVAELCCDNSWCRQNRFRLFGEALYLRAGDANVVYAASVTGCDPLTDTPTGMLGIAEADTNLGFRAGFAVPFGGGHGCQSGCGGGCDGCGGCSGGHSIVASYTWYESDTNSEIDVAQHGFVLESKVTHPGTASCAAGSASATAGYDLGFQFADVDFRTPLKPCCGCYGNIHLLAGLRYGHLEQNFLAQQTVGAPAGLTDVSTQIRFDGVGARFGLEGEMHSNIGLFLYGRGVCNFLGGEFDATYEQTNQFTTAVIANRFNEYRVISILEAELGVGWVGKDDKFRVSAGYQANSWLNVLNTADYINGVRTWNVAGQSSTMTFDGVSCRIEFRH